MPDSNITKKALAQTMKELMAKQPFSKISVGDICDACGMSRKSFYYHFRDKYDLVNWIFDTEFLQSIRPENLYCWMEASGRYVYLFLRGEGILPLCDADRGTEFLSGIFL